MRNFIKYSIIGAIFTFFNVFFNWLLIDILKLNSVLSSSIVVIVLFIGKYYTYLWTKFIQRNITGYLIISASSIILNVFFIWFFVDIIGLSALISSSFVVTSLFIVRYFMLRYLK
jgi:hypothetical protein